MADFVVPALSEPALANQPTAARLAVIIDLLSGIAGGANSVYQPQAAGTGPTALSGGSGGAKGDILTGVLLIPGTSAASAVTIKDGANAAITIFAGGGVTALSDLKPFYVPIGAPSTNGAWQLTTGANITAIAVGKFS